MVMKVPGRRGLNSQGIHTIFPNPKETTLHTSVQNKVSELSEDSQSNGSATMRGTQVDLSRLGICSFLIDDDEKSQADPQA